MRLHPIANTAYTSVVPVQTGNNLAPAFDIYILDAGAGYANLGGFDIPGLIDYAQAVLEVDCDGHLWAVDQTYQAVYEVDSGEVGVCSWQDIP